jgi:hypothetical protein
MARPGIRVVLAVATVVLLQVAVVMVMASSSGVPDEYLPSDQFNKGSFGTADCVEGRHGLGSLSAMANMTDHPNSTTVPHEHPWMGILEGCELAVCFCTRLISLSWLCILIMGKFKWRLFKWRLRRWTPPHALILIATVNAAIASLSSSVANVAALFTASVGLIMLVANWHFGLLECAALSLAYWCSALWIGWTISPVGGIALGIVAVVMRRSVLLFSKKITILYYCEAEGRDVSNSWLWSKSIELLKEQARQFFSLPQGSLFFSCVGGEFDGVTLDPGEPFPDTGTQTYRLKVVAGARSSPHPHLSSCIESWPL